MHGAHELWPAAEDLPAAQLPHVALHDAPASALKVPALHAVHCPSELPPQPVRWVPAAHVLHGVQARWPLPSWYMPASQARHSELPLTGWTLPASHAAHESSHAPWPPLKVPLSHATQSPPLEPLQPTRENPAGHVRQVLQAACWSVSWYLPTAQVLHDCQPSLLNEPARQAPHCVSHKLFTAFLNLPPGQLEH